MCKTFESKPQQKQNLSKRFNVSSKLGAVREEERKERKKEGQSLSQNKVYMQLSSKSLPHLQGRVVVQRVPNLIKQSNDINEPQSIPTLNISPLLFI